MPEPIKTLVTGGAGFVGSHLVSALLQDDYAVSVIDNLSAGHLRSLNHAATFYHAGLNDARIAQIIRRERPEIIFHLAAQTSVRQSALDPLADARANILGTINLLTVAAAEGVDKFVFASTGGAIYGDPPTVPCDENTPVNPITPYALSKRVGELYLELFQRTYGLDYTILRYANVYGPGQDPHGEAGVVAIFAGMMLDEKLPRPRPSIYGDGQQQRDFVYVDDVVAANLAAVDRGDSGIYNIGSGAPVTINQIYDLLREYTGYDQPAVYRPRRAGEVINIALDSSRAARELGWQPKVSLADGLRRTVDSIRSLRSPRPDGSRGRSARARHRRPDRAP